MELTYKQTDLLINMVNACITRATQSGIPIGKEYYADIDEIKKNYMMKDIVYIINKELYLRENK